MVEIERMNKAHLGFRHVFIRTKISEPAPLKAATLADCSVGFLFAKAVCFYWPTDAFLYLHRWPSFICAEKKKNEAAQRNVHTRLSFNHL